MVRQRGHFGILHDLQRTIGHYTGYQVFLISLDDGYSISIKGPDSDDMPGIFIPKESGTVNEELFNAAVSFLEDLLKENAS